ncbi:MAG: glycosyltransferase, partial [Ignavibacteriota bacterium]
MKILIITPRIPYPPYRGDKLKIFNISRILAKTNDVHIITFYRNNKDKDLIKPLQELGIRVSLIKLRLIESLINTFFAIFQTVPFQVAWYSSKKMKKGVEGLLKTESFDVVYYHLIRSAQYLSDSGVNTSLNVIDFTDAVSLYLSRMSEKEKNIFKKLFIKSELRRIDNYENISEKFDVLFICSEIDRKFLKEKGIKQDIQVLNNGIDTDYFYGEQNDYDSKRIIFTGNMPYYANTDAAIYFAKEIFPLILKKDPEVEFYIVGQQPPHSIKQLASKNIFVTGYVKDIKAEYLKSAVNIAPMRFGAGTLNKVLESIALGVPVVATSISMLGLPQE